MTRIFTLVWVLLLFGQIAASAQSRRFPALERRNDVVALVADVASGRMVGSVHAGEAFLQRYHPASIFKLALAEVALRSGAATSQGWYTCRGRDTIKGRIDRCWTPRGHGRMDMEQAVAHSCNLYFRALAHHLSRQDIIQSARRLGMLTPSGFPGSNEPTTTPKLDDENILGEAFTVSPAQMLRTSIVLARRQVTAGARYDPLHRGMTLSVSNGTAREAWKRSIQIAGKTGTDMTTGLPGRSAGWFIGYAPAERPRFAVVVLLKNGRGSGAARIARDIISAMR